MMIRASIAFILLSASFVAGAQTIIVSPLNKVPQLDGEMTDWQQVPGQRVMLTPTQPKSKMQSLELEIRAGYFDEYVYFYLRWPDTTESIVHKPFVWDEASQRYKKGSAREDRFAFQFEMSGEYSTDWRNTNDFEADMWHWKAFRSNPIGVAHDKKTVISKEKITRAAIVPSPSGNRYVLRSSDEGSSLYRTLRYGEKKQDVMPKYELLPNPSGSVADIEAKGIWRNDHWHLELKRKLDTGHADDAQFSPGQVIRGGIAIFDATVNEDHVISKTLLFQF